MSEKFLVLLKLLNVIDIDSHAFMVKAGKNLSYIVHIWTKLG